MATTRTPDERDGRISTAVVDAVAAAEGVEPTALTPPLFEAVDPEALDALWANAEGTAESTMAASFSYCGYDVAVDADGEVHVAPSTPGGSGGD